MKNSIVLSLSGVRKYRSMVYFGLMVASFSVIGDEVDRRQTLNLNDAQRNHVLTEMRAMLSGTQAILAALAANDRTELVRQARLLGMNMGHKAESSVHDVLPAAFMQMGMAVHRVFDQIAADVEAGADANHTLLQLSSALSTCASCHETYQIERLTTEQAVRPASIH